MASDMVVALGKTTADGRSLFGHNWGRPSLANRRLLRIPGRTFAFGEKVQTPYLDLPQARQTLTTLGCQSLGQWGFHHGVNEQGVAIGCTALRTRLVCERPGLTGPDLVRLGLERSATARQAVDHITELIVRHGQGAFSGQQGAAEHDNAFLIADGREAFALEASGSFWVYQEIQQVRAMSDVSTIRQDWDGIARGLASEAISRDWWPGDGSKLDFATAVVGGLAADTSALRRWGRATLLLEEQNGHIDLAYLRLLLSDHYEGTEHEVDPLETSVGPSPLCQHEGDSMTAASLVASLGGPPLAWCALGPPCTSVYFPIFLDGELPRFWSLEEAPHAGTIGSRTQQLLGTLGSNPERWALVRAALGQLQARFDADTEDFLAESGHHRRDGNLHEFQRLAELFMQHTAERFESAVEDLHHATARRMVPGYHQESSSSARPRI